MKLLLDAGFPHRTVALLRANGHDVVHANDIRLGESDENLLSIAAAERRIVFTLDADFHQLLAAGKTTSTSVVRFRIQSLRHEEAAELIEKILVRCSEELAAGAAISANRQKVRIRLLPIG